MISLILASIMLVLLFGLEAISSAINRLAKAVEAKNKMAASNPQQTKIDYSEINSPSTSFNFKKIGDGEIR